MYQVFKIFLKSLYLCVLVNTFSLPNRLLTLDKVGQGFLLLIFCQDHFMVCSLPLDQWNLYFLYKLIEGKVIMFHLEKIYFSRLKRILTQKPHKGQQIGALTYGIFGRLKVYDLELWLCHYTSQ